jgi:uncharacterized protein YbjT (DUF2867 family)
MRVVIAGGHGKIAMLLEQLLVERGDSAVGLIRNPDHDDELRRVGAEPVVIDMESSTPEELAGTLRGADAAVFAAGAGPGSGATRKDTVDRAGAILLADAAELAGVGRFVQISAMGLDRAYAEGVDDVFSAYLRAKEAAERDLHDRGDRLQWTILRPGRLTDGPAAGKVKLAEEAGGGEVSRADVAGVVLALLDAPATAGKTLELVGGSSSIAEAVAAL